MKNFVSFAASFIGINNLMSHGDELPKVIDKWSLDCLILSDNYDCRLATTMIAG